MPVADLGGGVELSITVTVAEDEAAFRHEFVSAVAKVFGQLGFKSDLNRLRKILYTPGTHCSVPMRTLVERGD